MRKDWDAIVNAAMVSHWTPITCTINIFDSYKKAGLQAGFFVMVLWPGMPDNIRDGMNDGLKEINAKLR